MEMLELIGEEEPTSPSRDVRSPAREGKAIWHVGYER